MNNKILGTKGETLAVNYLTKNNYKIIEKNFSNKIGEIDIICLDNDTIVFVEVKTRETKLYGYGREAVTLSKQRKIRLVATSYLKKKNQLESKCRFDVIEILGDKLTHIKNCF